MNALKLISEMPDLNYFKLVERKGTCSNIKGKWIKDYILWVGQ